jgi:hypothetical protein
VALSLVAPIALFYVLRARGTGLHVALALSTGVFTAPAVVSLVRRRRLDPLSSFFTVMTVGALAVSLVPGSTRVLLAKEAVLTGVTGLWFLAGPWTRRPLAYHFTRPLLEGRLRWPGDWEQLWEASPRFRHMWLVGSAMWGIGLLLDAGLRVRLAFAAPPDRVPVLGLLLYGGTILVLNVLTNAYYVWCGVHDPRSPLRRGAPLGASQA